MPTEAIVHVIDDDEAVRQSVEFLLRTSGIAAKTYSSAAAFLAASPTIDSGCVITDVRMPEMSGIDLLQRLGERQITKHQCLRSKVRIDLGQGVGGDFVVRVTDDLFDTSHRFGAARANRARDRRRFRRTEFIEIRTGGRRIRRPDIPDRLRFA